MFKILLLLSNLLYADTLPKCTDECHNKLKECIRPIAFESKSLDKDILPENIRTELESRKILLGKKRELVLSSTNDGLSLSIQGYEIKKEIYQEECEKAFKNCKEGCNKKEKIEKVTNDEIQK